MAKIKSGKAPIKALSCRFGGMGKHTPLSPVGAEDICNFRILPNGVLQTRGGYAVKKSFAQSKPLRGFWEGTLAGSPLIFAVAGNVVYRLSGEELRETLVGSVYAGQGMVHFCAHQDKLYLLDGISIQVYDPTIDHFNEIEAYVPLYGYQWSPSSYGDIHEEVNLLTPRLRVHYYNSEGSSVFLLPYYADAVEVVRADGQETTNYTFEAGSNRISFEGTPPTVLEVGFTVSLNEELAIAMLASQMAYILANDGEERMLLWGDDARLFVSHPVSGPSLSSCHVLYPKATPLYFRAEDVLFLGDSTHPITAVCPLWDTLLAFTSDRIWSLHFEKGEMHTELAMNGIGCATASGAIPYENTVIAAMQNGIYRITSSVARPDQLVLTRLSVGIDQKLPISFGARAQLFWNVARGEIWAHDPTSAYGEVWVWNANHEEWYRFEGIAASFFFSLDGKVGFADGHRLCFFEPNCYTDAGSPIAAHVRTAYIDLGTADAPARAMRAMLYAAPANAQMELLIETERASHLRTLQADAAVGLPTFYDLRTPAHRHRFLRFFAKVYASLPAELYRLDVYSKP